MKETVKSRRNKNMRISGASDSTSPNHLTESWIERAARLEKLLTICPRDILVRCDLASVLEELGQYEKALINWKAVLADDSNNLKAREGMARCRLRIGRPLQSNT
jgi:tetratricopeptide (TPR) repeat protein